MRQHGVALTGIAVRGVEYAGQKAVLALADRPGERGRHRRIERGRLCLGAAFLLGFDFAVCVSRTGETGPGREEDKSGAKRR